MLYCKCAAGHWPKNFQPPMNPDWCVSDIFYPFFNHLIGEERQCRYFKHAKAMARTVDRPVVFKNGVISKGLWLPKSHDLSYCDCLWGSLK